MQHFRDTDGTPAHRKGLRFHAAKCRSGGTPLHTALRAEALVVYGILKVKARASEDAEDDLADARAESDTTEIAFENAVRDLDNDLERLDRETPGLNARLAIFPDGFGAVIEPEGEKQLEVIPALEARIKPFETQPALTTSLAKFATTKSNFKVALAAEDTASDAVETAFAEEIVARAAARAQLTSAHARLRDLYKTRPAQAEAFFMKLGRKEGKPKAPDAAAPKVEAAEPTGGGVSTGIGTPMAPAKPAGG